MHPLIDKDSLAKMMDIDTVIFNKMMNKEITIPTTIADKLEKALMKYGYFI